MSVQEKCSSYRLITAESGECNERSVCIFASRRIKNGNWNVAMSDQHGCVPNT